MQRVQSAASPTDPVTLQIVRGALRAIQSEMEAVIERTAMSPFIREKKDFYAALFDAEGRLIAGSNLPVFGDVVGPVGQFVIRNRNPNPPNTMLRLGNTWYEKVPDSGSRPTDVNNGGSGEDISAPSRSSMSMREWPLRRSQIPVLA